MYQPKRRRLGALFLKTAACLVVVCLAGRAEAQGSFDRGRFRAAHTPLIVVVSLSSQWVTVYSARGKLVDAPASTGMPGYETPVGIYSVLQMRRDHYSNLYNDAPMPFMQRLTWSGIALHAGDLPGYRASRGCVRMPYDFAGQLFELSKRGTRVVVVRDDASPVDFAHPALFRPGPIQPGPIQPVAGQDGSPGDLHPSSVHGGARLESVAMGPPLTRRALVASKEAAVEAAARKAQEVRRAAARIEREAREFEEALEPVEAARRRAKAQIEEADLLMTDSSSAGHRKLKEIKDKAQERLAAVQAEIDAIYAEGRDKIDAVRAARAEVRAAEAAKVAAQNEATLAAGRPVSVFISRKTQRLYVRRAFQPVFESDVTIDKPNAPVGTMVFTAMDWSDDDAGLRWSALSMYPRRDPGSRSERGGGPAQTNPAAAKAALERVALPQDAIDRISALVTPGSSLIISDEALSHETGEATDFVVLMSGEPQGGTGRRSPGHYFDDDYDAPFAPGGGFNPFSWW